MLPAIETYQIRLSIWIIIYHLGSSFIISNQDQGYVVDLVTPLISNAQFSSYFIDYFILSKCYKQKLINFDTSH